MFFSASFLMHEYIIKRILKYILFFRRQHAVVNSFLCVRVCVCVIMASVSWFDSELAGPQQNVPRTRRGGERDPAAEAQVLLLGPERGLAGPCPAQPAVCPGEATTRRLQTARCSPSPAHAAQHQPASSCGRRCTEAGRGCEVYFVPGSPTSSASPCCQILNLSIKDAQPPTTSVCFSPLSSL